MTMTRTLHCQVAAADVGERADVVLGRCVAGLSRRQARVLGLAGKLRIDGQRKPPSTRVALGQELVLELDQPAATAFELEPLRVTDDFVYVVKPAGVHTIALTPDQPGTLATAVVARWPECGSASEDPREGGAVHRLDRPTSGIVAFARSREVWQRARTGFAEGRVTKLYLAACRPTPGSDVWPPELPKGGLRGWIEPAEPIEGPDWTPPGARVLSLDPVRIRAPLGRAEMTGRVAVRLDGRRASTVVQPIAESPSTGDAGPLRLFRVRLETGLRHQVRVHLSWVGLPIVGDLEYSPGEHEGVSSVICLHAFVLDLSAVIPSEQPMVVEPSPDFWPEPGVAA